ncbi:MAG: MotA/TolQ/ExbB proton channel family protein [Planctomycetes bacterium]|nr:MotA/TolQ/ExbB proton channel family protein [Planctomycetota bacterium]
MNALRLGPWLARARSLDRATFGGLLAGVLVLGAALSLGGSLRSFLDLPSLLLVLGGTLAATLVQHPLATLRDALRQARAAFVEGPLASERTLDELLELARRARRDGLPALEADLASVSDPFFQRALRLLVDGFSPELVKDVLEVEHEHEIARLEEGRAVFEHMASCAPAFGMIGTVIGLVQMLQRLDEPRAIGGGMAVALLTTLYGAVLANLICAPLGGKLGARARATEMRRLLQIEAIVAIQSGEKPSLLRERLLAHLEKDAAREPASIS